MSNPKAIKAKPTLSEPKKRKRGTPPGRTLEAKEQELVNAAIKLAAKQISNGTVTSQVLTHFLKLGSVTEKLAREKLESENALLKAKAEALESTKTIEALYKDALEAMQTYSGNANKKYIPEEDDDI